MTPPRVVAYRRRRTAIPAEPKLFTSIQYWLSTWSIATYVLLAAFIAAISILIADLTKDRETEEGGIIPGLNSDALWQSAGYALPTMAFWIFLFLLVNRYKMWTLRALLLTVGWGACMSVFMSYYLNSWASEHMAVVDPMSGVDAVRAAVFVAPFVEESSKACIIFLIAVLDRQRFSSRVSGAVLGGLVGAGFAFTENIVYYARAIVYGSYTAGTGDVQAAVRELVLLRGVYTCFGHPLFTLMTGVGVAFAVASRSKVVRVVAPLAGFLASALLHMLFNGVASVMPMEQMLYVYLLVGLPLVVIVLIRVVITTVRQGRTLTARLSDYVDMGWLPESYQTAFSTLRRRAWTLVISLWHGNVFRTWQLQHAVTELAFLRESITRGTVDEYGVYKEHELIDQIHHLATSTRAVVDGTGLRPYWPWINAWRRRRANSRLLRRSTAPGGARTNPVPLKYSAVDPRWGPPG